MIQLKITTLIDLDAVYYDDGDERYLNKFNCDILDVDDEGENGKKIGNMIFYRILGGAAMNNHVDIIEYCDSIAQEIYNVACAVYRHDENGVFKEDVCEACGDVLYLDALQIDPEYRGKGLGLKVIKQVIDSFPAGIVVIYPCPFGEKLNEREQERAKKKLRRYYATMGFKPISPKEEEDDPKYMWLDPNCPIKIRKWKSQTVVASR